MFQDKRFEPKDADLKGKILVWLIIVPLPAFLLIHGVYGVFNGNAPIGIVELIFGCIVAGFWIKHIAKSKREEKFILGIIEEGSCHECKILEYSKEKDHMDTPECVVIESEGEIYILGPNNMSVPNDFPVGNINKMFIRNRGEQVDILVTKYEVNELATTIDNKVSVLPKILEKYSKKYNIEAVDLWSPKS